MIQKSDINFFYAGSFNPFTVGHADIVKRALKIAKHIIIGVGVNQDKPNSMLTAKSNVDAIQDFVKKEGLDNEVEVILYSGLTGEEALKRKATCLLRGVRSSTDFEYERSLACANKKLFGLETFILTADPVYSYISSSLIRDLKYHGREDLASELLP